MLEHIIAAAILKISYLATGVALCLLGKSLLEKGISGAFQGEGKVASTTFRVATSSPGLVFAVAGLAAIITGIVTPAVYREGPAPAPAAAKADSGGTPDRAAPSLQALAGTIRESRLAQAGPETQFALSQYEASIRAVKKGQKPAGTAYLVRAIIVMPALLARALASPELAETVANPAFQTITRARFTLPLELEPEAEPATGGSPLLSFLRLYIVSMETRNQERHEDVSAEMAAMPTRSGAEPQAATVERFKTILAKNPTVLEEALKEPKYQWLLSDPQLVADLESSIQALSFN